MPELYFVVEEKRPDPQPVHTNAPARFSLFRGLASPGSVVRGSERGGLSSLTKETGRVWDLGDNRQPDLLKGISVASSRRTRYWSAVRSFCHSSFVCAICCDKQVRRFKQANSVQATHLPLPVENLQSLRGGKLGSCLSDSRARR